MRRGDVLVLRDEDYLFGMGAMVVRVVAVHELRKVRGEAWVFLRAFVLGADGHSGRLRDVLVSPEAIRERRRRSG